MTRVHTAEHVVPLLWFFALQFDGGGRSSHNCNIPCGFWSTERCPTTVPAGITSDSTPQFEPIQKGVKAPLCTSIQVLGDLVFTMQTKYAQVSIRDLYAVVYCINTAHSGRMLTEVLELSEDELLAFRESQESHHPTGDTDASESDDSGKDGLAADPNKNHYESPASDYQDATGAGYDRAEE